MLRRANNLNPSLAIRPCPKNYNFKNYNFPSIPKAADCKERSIMITLIPFAHRRNPDASIDSICTTCFQTIASEDSEGKLIAHEERHSCDLNWQLTRAHIESRESPSARPSLNRLG